MNDKWLEVFGETARRLANAPITNTELGKTLEVLFIRMEAESMRDAREEINRTQTH